MPYHPAIGHLRGQLPRIAFIAALLAAAGTLIALHQEQAALPSDRWYQLSRQRVMEADLTWRLAEAIDRLGSGAGAATREQAQRLYEQAIAMWERRVLTETPNHAAAYRLGVIYGRRGYAEQASDMLTLAASIDERHSDFYFAISEIYSDDESGDRELRAHAATIAGRDSWIADIALADAYRRLGDEAMLGQVEARRDARTRRFALQFLGIAIGAGTLIGLGIVTLGIALYRRGFTVRERSARLPFVVPWTIIDVAEAIAVLLFTMVVGGLFTNMTLGRVLPPEAPLTQPILMAAQYVLLGAVTLGVIFYRMRRHSSNPLRTLGWRFERSTELIGAGLAGYGVLLAGLFIFALLIGSLLGDAAPFAQTIEEIIGAAQTPGEIAIYFVLVCIFAPILEEIVFRGYVYGGLRRLMPMRHAVIIGAALFAAVHLNAAAFIMIGLIGVMLCYLYERTRSLLPGMVAHGVHNGFVLAVMLLQSA